MENLLELLQNMSISEGLNGRHIGVMASNESDAKEESNHLEVPLIMSKGNVLLVRNKSKSGSNMVRNQNLDHQIKFNLHV